MMHHSRALILRKDGWREADWRITALTADFGKIRLLARGARKHSAKLRGHLEPGGVCDISFVVGRNGYRLTTARLCEWFPRTHASWSRLRARAVVLASADANLLEEGEGAGDLFSMAVSALATIEAARELGTVNRAAAWFQASLLCALGLLPAPGTPEGREIPTLLAVAGEPPGRFGGQAVDDHVLAAECRALARQLGGAARLILPVAAGGPTL